jgi:hypothetical protein
MPLVPRSQDASRATTHEIQEVTPYRLDFTVSALRGMATNPVDVFTAAGRHLRALGRFAEPGHRERHRAARPRPVPSRTDAAGNLSPRPIR